MMRVSVRRLAIGWAVGLAALGVAGPAFAEVSGETAAPGYPPN